MGEGGTGHGVEGGGHVVRLGGLGWGGDLLQGGVLVGPSGLRVELVGPWLSPGGRGHIVLIELGGCLRGSPIL